MYNGHEVIIHTQLIKVFTKKLLSIQNIFIFALSLQLTHTNLNNTVFIVKSARVPKSGVGMRVQLDIHLCQFFRTTICSVQKYAAIYMLMQAALL